MQTNTENKNNSKTESQACVNCGCQKRISRADEERVLHDIAKTAEMGMQALDIVKAHVTSSEFAKKLDEFSDAYARISERCQDYMDKNGVEDEFFGSVKQAFQRGAIKMGMLGEADDSRIAEHLIKGTNIGTDCIAKNINNVGDSISEELLTLCKDFENLLNRTLESYRKYL